MMLGLFSIARLEELDDAEDRQVVGAAVPGQGVRVADVVLLELLEAGPGPAEAGDLAPQVGEDVLLGRDGPAVDVDVAGVGGDAVGDRAHDRLVLDVGPAASGAA